MTTDITLDEFMPIMQAKMARMKESGQWMEVDGKLLVPTVDGLITIQKQTNPNLMSNRAEEWKKIAIGLREALKRSDTPYWAYPNKDDWAAAIKFRDLYIEAFESKLDQEKRTL